MRFRDLNCCAAIIAGVALGLCLPHRVAAESASIPATPAAEAVRIAVVQQRTVPGDKERNRAAALRFADEALAKHADIIVFHEAVTVGYVDNLKELAEEVDGATTQAFQALLEKQKSDALIMYGLVEQDGSDLYTSATVVSRNGVVANYRKTHLWWAASGVRHEPTFFRAGDQLVTFDLKGHKSGIMICYDGDFPEMTRAYANLDCKMLFWLNNRQSRGHAEVRPLASRNSMIMATSCVFGEDEGGRHCSGGSNITAHDGQLLADIWDKEGIVYADVVPDEVPQSRQKNPWIRGHRSDLYR